MRGSCKGNRARSKSRSYNYALQRKRSGSRTQPAHETSRLVPPTSSTTRSRRSVLRGTKMVDNPGATNRGVRPVPVVPKEPYEES